MTLLAVVLQVAATVVALHIVAVAVVVRPDGVRGPMRTARQNAAAVGPTAVVLGTILAINGLVRDFGVELSWLIGVNVTEDIYALEGEFVAALQSVATPPLTAYFSFVYVFGYVFLLTFPLLAYALHDDSRPLRTTLVAYILNYVIGLVCYVAIVAYGPRNFMPELVDSLLFTNWPQSQLLTAQVNVNTNVFPSLHTSLSVTVAILAYRFHELYPRWTPIAGVLAVSIAVSTMYLGIHWLTDVVFGVVLAAVSVRTASRSGVVSERNEAFGLRAAVVEWWRKHL